MMDNVREETGSGLGDFSIGVTQAEELEGKEPEKFTNGDWASEMEMEMMLGEMIAMTELAASVEGPYASGSFGIDLDISTPSSWDMDAAVGGIGAH